VAWLREHDINRFREAGHGLSAAFGAQHYISLPWGPECLRRLEGLDRTQEEAALVLGADQLTVFRTITIPQLWPGILGGALLAFTMSFDDYVITSLVSGTGSSTLPIVVYSMVRRNIEPTVNAISTLILVATSLAIWVVFRLTRERPLAAARG